MLKSKSLLIGAAALAAATSSPAIASQQAINLNQLDSESLNVLSGRIPCHAKVPEKCKTLPPVKNPKNPILKNISFKKDVFKSGPLKNEATGTTEILTCLHFVEAHITRDGDIRSVNDTDVSKAENCLELFAQGLLE